ncbi:hypothetical protein EJB05_27534, partial [Eragrostis curvula]
MAPDQMFDLNFEPVDVDGDDANDALNNLFGTPQGVGQQPEVTDPDEGHAESEDDNAESAGMTVPTATTTSGTVDVEEGVEVISTPNDPYVGMTFETCEAAKSFYNSYPRYKGFSVRIDNSKETKWAGGTSRVKYVCHKAGVNKKKKPAADGPITEENGSIDMDSLYSFVVDSCGTRRRRASSGYLRGAPAYIIIDQASAIAAAIEKVFPEAIHRLCRWHIMENVRKHMGAFLAGNKQLTGDFNDCISNIFSPEEFQSKWQAVIDTHELHGHEGFDALHRIRQD